MIRVMIVDDEPIIRAGLTKVIRWEELGCQVANVCANGREALAVALEDPPDLLVSDIKMPKMDGLELLRQLREAGIDCRAILVTGYKEFEYAKRAMAYGVNDYVLKPVDHEQFSKTVARLAEEIHAARRMESERKNLLERVQQSAPILKYVFLSDLLFRSPAQIDNLCEKMTYFGIQSHFYRVVGIQIDRYAELTDGWSEEDAFILAYIIQEQLDDLAEKRGLVMDVYLHDSRIYGIVKDELTIEEMMDAMDVLSRRIRQIGKFTVSIGVSERCEDFRALRGARKEADRCLTQCERLGGDSIMCSRDICPPETTGAVRPDTDAAQWLRAIENGKDMELSLNALLNQLSTQQSVGQVKLMVSEILLSAMGVCFRNYGECEDLNRTLEATLSKLCCAHTPQKVVAILRESGTWIADYIRETQMTRNSQIVRQAIAYMESHCTSDVSLEEAAAQVYLSKWYFSKLFKQETGQNFIEYFTRLRVEYAKRLMRDNPTLKAYEVAEATGYANVRYFTQVFKHYTGATPSEYRR